MWKKNIGPSRIGPVYNHAGHTDYEGSEEYNMGLSKRRAESVKRYLVEKFGIDTSKISTVGYGESQPAAKNDTAAGRQKNRRVVANIE